MIHVGVVLRIVKIALSPIFVKTVQNHGQRVFTLCPFFMPCYWLYLPLIWLVLFAMLRTLAYLLRFEKRLVFVARSVWQEFLIHIQEYSSRLVS